MITASALNSIIAIGTVCLVIGLLAYRLAWSGPFLLMLIRVGLLPQRWRRWIEGGRR